MQKSEVEAEAELWKYVLGFSELRMVKCAVELGLPDAVEAHGRPMTLSELSLAVTCPENTLFRVMRFLNKRGIFKKLQPDGEGGTAALYAQTQLSRLLARRSMGHLLLVQDGADSRISVEDLIAKTGSGSDPNDKLWSPGFGDEEFQQTMRDYFDCTGRVTASSMIKNCPEIFQDVSSLVDVGGRAGTSLRMLVAAFPDMRGVNFDLPHVVAEAPALDRVEHVGGDMFEAIPTGDAVMLMTVLHDWGDQLCVKVLKKCKEAIGDSGKVIIVDAVLDDEDGEERNDDEFSRARLASDMGMLIGTETGRERTAKEWAQLIEAAGFRSHTIKHIKAIPSVIVAYP